MLLRPVIQCCNLSFGRRSVIAVASVATTPLPPPPSAFVFLSHFAFEDAHNETAKDLPISLINKDLNHRFEIGDPGNQLLDSDITVDQDLRGLASVGQLVPPSHVSGSVFEASQPQGVFISAGTTYVGNQKLW